VTTFQMLRILALNCLISAYMLSVLYFHGVKNGDQQLTIAGMAISAFFLFISRTQPLDRLAPVRPPSSLFSAHLVATVTGQFAIHCAVLFVALRMCEPYIDRSDPAMKPDGEFKPNVLNTTVFLLSTWLQVTTFLANYRGHPFMQSLSENKTMSRCIFVCYAALLLAASGLSPELEELLQLSHLPSSEFHGGLISLMISDTAGSLLVERACSWFFETRHYHKQTHLLPPPPVSALTSTITSGASSPASSLSSSGSVSAGGVQFVFK
jgi:cation-transporting ATPase 13A1